MWNNLYMGTEDKSRWDIAQELLKSKEQEEHLVFTLNFKNNMAFQSSEGCVTIFEVDDNFLFKNIWVGEDEFCFLKEWIFLTINFIKQ